MMNIPQILDSSRLQYAPWQAAVVATTPNPQVSQEGYRPWAADQSPNTYIEDPDGNMWFFDAVIRLEHNNSQRITEHPVQTGAAITDHSFSLPAQLTLEIGMSDVMSSYVGQWGTDVSEPTKSVMAYQTLLKWKNYGTPLYVETRLYTYMNMVIQTMSAPDDKNTLYGLKCIVTFREIFTASIIAQKTNILPHDVDDTPRGDLLSGPYTPRVGSLMSSVEETIQENASLRP